MTAKNKISLLASVVLARLIGRRNPLAISWMITRRCNYACQYCNERSVSNALELDTAQVLFVIERLRNAGVKIISFTGGEPLLRDDIGEIINHCVDRDIIARLNSKGSLVPAKIEEIKRLDALTLSLDGSEDVNDAVRGKGAFCGVIHAAQAAISYGVKIRFLTVLSSKNLDLCNIDALLGLAKDFKAEISSQPAVKVLLRGQGPNLTMPEIADYRKAIDYLMDLKKKGFKDRELLDGFAPPSLLAGGRANEMRGGIYFSSH